MQQLSPLKAHSDLCEFLRLREAELRPSGELCVVMVAAGESVYYMPPPGKEAPVLSSALDQLVREGLLEQVTLMAVTALLMRSTRFYQLLLLLYHLLLLIL